ncbi:MAG: lipid-A-disaccharide synthase-related protein [Armatimonadota bacterium]|nr:lipid-A-disaccharide synthase-related protein [Armatimonadota bacterium]
MTARILFVSNGVSEDLIASRILASLPPEGVTVTAYPLVGRGLYPPTVPLLDPRSDLPSGGFSFRAGMRGLRADLAAGIVGLWRAQRRTLAAQRGRFDLVVAVGDVYCLWMAHFASREVIFVSTADSIHTGGFGTQARWIIRRHARQTFARDPETAAALAAHGLLAVSVGNVMMDQLDLTGETFGWPPQTPVVTLLPGSRRDAPENAVLIARAAGAIADEIGDVGFLMAVAPTVSEAALRDRLCALTSAPASRDGDVAIGSARLHLTRSFPDAVARAWVVLGMAGTAHEQAAGLGRPVVAFPGPSAQFGPAFLTTQHRLLGDALVPTRNWREAAAAVVRLLRDPEERRRRGEIGKARMGPPGAAQRIADDLVKLLLSEAGGGRPG